MSRSDALVVLLASLAGTIAIPAAAQDATDHRVDAMMARARDAYAIPPAPAASPCDDAGEGAIVVCGRETGEGYRVPGDGSRTDTGVPHADVGFHASAGGVTVRGCFLQKCPREVYLIDLGSIPEAPPGSDADKIAKGEMRAP